MSKDEESDFDPDDYPDDDYEDDEFDEEPQAPTPSRVPWSGFGPARSGLRAGLVRRTAVPFLIVTPSAPSTC